MRCVACQICEKECPPKCIYIEKSKDKKPDYVGKMQIYPARFDIDISVCMSCQICVEVCPFEAIKMDTEFELATDDRFGGLLLDREQLAKSNEYYHKIHPTEAAEVDARLAEEKAKAEAKAKAAAEAAAAKAAAAAAAEAGGARSQAGGASTARPSRRRRRVSDARNARPDLRSPQQLAGGIFALGLAGRRGRAAVRGGDHRCLSRAVCADRAVERKGLGRMQNRSARIAWVRSGFCSRSPTASSR